MQGTVLDVRIKATRGVPTEEREELSLIEGSGIEGDVHFNDTSLEKRQVLLLDAGTLSQEGYGHGVLREQVLVDFPGLQGLEAGARLMIGTAQVEITFDCAPCLTMAGYVNEEGGEFVRKMMGKRGMLARVTGSGKIRRGDTVRLMNCE